MFKIAYGAGHNDSTTRGIPTYLHQPWTNEWRLNDRVARYFADAASQYEGVELLRVDDPKGIKPTVLADRCAEANAWGADFFLAIHHNGGINGGTGGGMVAFSYQEGTKAAQYRDAIYAACLANGGIRGDRWKGNLTGNLYVLRHTNMPAVLMEYGFMDSVTDVPIILTEEFAKAQAYATMDGIAKIAKLKKKQATELESETPAERYTLKLRVLHNGCRGNDVKSMQALIGFTGIYCEADGIFGAKTKKAVEQYQKKNTLPVTGIIDKNTASKLLGL